MTDLRGHCLLLYVDWRLHLGLACVCLVVIKLICEFARALNLMCLSVDDSVFFFFVVFGESWCVFWLFKEYRFEFRFLCWGLYFHFRFGPQCGINSCDDLLYMCELSQRLDALSQHDLGAWRLWERILFLCDKYFNQDEWGGMTRKVSMWFLSMICSEL